jgi:NAD(P)-dependent dehydrogenase (short-subunit alcohol dehydrogenase family)
VTVTARVPAGAGLAVPGRHAGRVVLVTGGGTGIGAATARRFAAEGARLALCGLDQAELDLTCEALAAAGAEARGWAGDVASEADVARIVDATLAHFGVLDALVNCAGTSAVGPVESTALTTWQRVFDTNAAGVFLMSRAAIPHLRARRGTIVNVASQLAFAAVGGFAAYCASKAAVVHFSRCLALELVDDGVRVNVVCPGAVDTPLLRSAFPGGVSPQGTLEQLVAAHPAGRLGSADEIAGAISFLASDDASFAVGAALVVDGGYTLP